MDNHGFSDEDHALERFRGRGCCTICFLDYRSGVT